MEFKLIEPEEVLTSVNMVFKIVSVCGLLNIADRCGALKAVLWSHSARKIDFIFLKMFSCVYYNVWRINL